MRFEARAAFHGVAALWLGIAACDSPPESGPSVSVEPERLGPAREWLRPDLSSETDWLSHPMDLAFDPRSGHLFVQDRDWKTILEIDADGQLIQTYGRAGEGPGELGHAGAIAVDDERVYALDVGNGKVVVFDRQARVEYQIKFAHYYRDLVPLEDGTIMLVPGIDRAIDILDRQGEVVGGLGKREDIIGACTDCAMARLSDGRVAVLAGTRPELWVFTKGAETPMWIDLYSMPLLERWRAEHADKLKQIQRMVREGQIQGGGRLWMMNQLDVAGPSHVTVSVGPPGIMETGLEFWRINVDTGNVERYDYGEPLVGYILAVDWPRVFTSQVEDGIIVEYRAGDGAR